MAALQLTRLTYRVVRCLEQDGGDYYEIGLDRDGRPSTIIVDDQHVAASLSVGSTVSIVIETDV